MGVRGKIYIGGVRIPYAREIILTHPVEGIRHFTPGAPGEDLNGQFGGDGGDVLLAPFDELLRSGVTVTVVAAVTVVAGAVTDKPNGDGDIFRTMFEPLTPRGQRIVQLEEENERLKRRVDEVERQNLDLYCARYPPPVERDRTYCPGCGSDPGPDVWACGCGYECDDGFPTLASLLDPLTVCDGYGSVNLGAFTRALVRALEEVDDMRPDG